MGGATGSGAQRARLQVRVGDLHAGEQLRMRALLETVERDRRWLAVHRHATFMLAKQSTSKLVAFPQPCRFEEPDGIPFPRVNDRSLADA